MYSICDASFIVCARQPFRRCTGPRVFGISWLSRYFISPHALSYYQRVDVMSFVILYLTLVSCYPPQQRCHLCFCVSVFVREPSSLVTVEALVRTRFELSSVNSIGRPASTDSSVSLRVLVDESFYPSGVRDKGVVST